MTEEFNYDVALNFAGEDRDYVDKVAHCLKENGVKVFYDKFEEATLWGKDLTEHLDDIYRKKARYCIIFISKHYVQKAWPSFEKRSALARQLLVKEYILPTYFDETDVLGLPPSIGHIDLRRKTAAELCSLIIDKIGKTRPVTASKPAYRHPKQKISFNPYEENENLISLLTDQLKMRVKSLGTSFSISIFNRQGRTCFRVVNAGKVIYSFDIEPGAISDKNLGFSFSPGEMSTSNGWNAFGEFHWDENKQQLMFKYESFADGEKSYLPSEFLDLIWEKICDAIES